MALPVINNCYRITINGSAAGGVVPHNVFHVAKASSDVTEVGDIVVAALEGNDGWWEPVHTAFEPFGITVLALDGTTPELNVPMSANGCSGEGEWVPEAAYLMSFHTSRRGPRGRGRMYIGPACENTINNGFTLESQQDALNTAWSGIVGTMDAEGCPVVVASYVHSDFHVADSLRINQNVATQRRRLLQQR